MCQFRSSARTPSAGTQPVASPQTPMDPQLCKQLRGLVFGIRIYAHRPDPDLSKIKLDFRELAKIFPERVPEGTTEPRTGLPAGDIFSARSKITGILRKIDACCADDAGEYSTVAITVRHVKETVRCLDDILSGTTPGKDVTATNALQNELSLPRVQRTKPAA